MFELPILTNIQTGPILFPSHSSPGERVAIGQKPISMILLLKKSVAVSKLQVAILARLSREMSQTLRID